MCCFTLSYGSDSGCPIRRRQRATFYETIVVYCCTSVFPAATLVFFLANCIPQKYSRYYSRCTAVHRPAKIEPGRPYLIWNHPWFRMFRPPLPSAAAGIQEPGTSLERASRAFFFCGESEGLFALIQSEAFICAVRFSEGRKLPSLKCVLACIPWLVGRASSLRKVVDRGWWESR